MHRFLSVSLVLSCLLSIVGCQPSPDVRPWAIGDLRAIDPLDAPTPAAELIAVYTRVRGLNVEIRVDLLDLTPQAGSSLRITFQDNFHFSEEPLMMDILPGGGMRTRGGDGTRIWPRLARDLELDTVTVSLNRALVGSRYRLDVSTFLTDPAAPVDEILDVRSDGFPPVRRAPALLVFQDTFPAVTPAQALRRWDGAHTGPTGARHGLRHILSGVEENRLPVVLLDLKTPASLAALDTLGVMQYVRQMAADNLLLLPDVAYADPVDVSLDLGRRAAQGFDLPASQFVYNASPYLVPGYEFQFIPLPDASHLAISGGKRLIPLPAADAIQATAEGPSLDVRRALVQAAFSPDGSDLVVLGGSLPRSTWGQADMAAASFAWLGSHPWVWMLDGVDLMTFPAGPVQAAPAQAEPESSPLLTDLRSAPGNVLTRSAWQTYFMLTAPASDEKTRTLRRNYLGQVGEQLAAARWAETPSNQNNCDQDLNGDTQTECILSNEKYFAILDPDGGRVSNLFYLDEAGPHQWIAPSSQFAVGLSDPSEWRLERGEAADPSVIPGAFLDNGSWGRYRLITFFENGMDFEAEEGGRKGFRLTQDGLEIFYAGNDSVDTRLPLVMDPQAFYFGPTEYRAALTPDSWTWGLSDGMRVEVRSDAARLSAQGFIASLPFLSMPEDPNLDYPTGHYLPFPLSVVTLWNDGNFRVQIGIR